MNPSLYSLVILVAVKMLTVQSASLIQLKDMKPTESDESSHISRTSQTVDQDYNLHNSKGIGFSGMPGTHKINPTSESTTASRTFTADTKEETSGAMNEAAAVTLLKRALRNKRRAKRCPGGLWICPTSGAALQQKTLHNKWKSHQKHKKRAF